MNTTDAHARLVAALTSVEPEARLIILEATPVHSLWIGGQLDLLKTDRMQVIMLDVVRDLFAAHLDCRKGREVTDFLSENSPPITYKQAHPWNHDAPSRKTGPRDRDLALAMADFLSSEDGYLAMRQDGRPSFLLVGDRTQWFTMSLATNDILVDTKDLLAAAEAASLIASAGDILQNVNLPGEVLDWR